MKRRGHPKLPATAEDFLDSLTPTLKPSTCKNYRQSLVLFHNWLASCGHAIQTFSREQAGRWLKHLAERGLAPVTRVHAINSVRIYLRALNDAGLLDVSADELLRRSDFPKLPVYLPRPLPPAADHELQRRLAASSAPYHRGLLAMRNTGLRIGELSGLTIDCVREDGLGNAYLKVPLGKMNSERLVPMDARTLALVEGLQRAGRPNRSLLLETPRGLKTHRNQLQAALDEATEGLNIADRVTTHRLRHTYATTLMNAGMSLMAIMKLLGHRDYRMTLRYAQITSETVGKEYRAALVQLETRYSLSVPLAPASRRLEPTEAINNLIRWVQKRSARRTESRKRTEALLKRLKRIREELTSL